ncbi:hypothetical protein [Kitasatospora sp. DSM 101779]|uniref:hypothetical protein n=1 Tax=Kitasatospora sp. DSM 101779 TaxID=2853165 RepID=UPI0021D8FF26|nr:hypothetical protein [Kitasatospora sp. DSM 101779]MCU7827053.1 hypothetical protein [Kitasatospora sp. DSM 101779]
MKRNTRRVPDSGADLPSPGFVLEPASRRVVDAAADLAGSDGEPGVGYAARDDMIALPAVIVWFGCVTFVSCRSAGVMV